MEHITRNIKTIAVTVMLVSCLMSHVPWVRAQQPAIKQSEQALEALIDFLNVIIPLGASKSVQTVPTTPIDPADGKPAFKEGVGMKSYRDIFLEIEQNLQVPMRVMEGVFMMESPARYKSFTQEQIEEYSKPGGVVPNCTANECSAIGAMQMTTGLDENGDSTCPGCGSLGYCPNMWVSYASSVNTYGGYSHGSKPCNLRDNIYASAAKLKKDSGSKSAQWSQEEVYRAGERYYGSCAQKYGHLGNRTYCEYLWWYYSSAAFTK
jgi:hypothetical protein